LIEPIYIGFVTAVEELGAGLPIGSPVEECDGRKAVPLCAYDRDALLGNDAFDFDVWLQVF